MSRSRSILIYCGDAVGLGHQRRNLAIASGLVRAIPDLEVVMLTSQPAGYLDCPERVDLIKLPSVTKSADGTFRPRTLTLHEGQLARLRRRIIESVASTLTPDLVLVDHHPTGVWGELEPLLRSWSRNPRGPRVVLGVRDILDEPRRTIAKWHRDGSYRALARCYDAILIYGDEAVFDTREHYRLQEETGVPAQYCGYVCPTNGVGAHAARHGLGVTAPKVVVATAGGGADGYPMIALCLEALRHVEAAEPLEMVCISGPLMRRELIADLRRRATELPARVLWSVDDLPSYFHAADVLLTMAGYNSLLEAMRMRRPTIVLPRAGPSAEQSIRAQRLASRGIVRALDRSQRTPLALARVLEEALAAPPQTALLPPMNGVDEAVRRLRLLLDGRSEQHPETRWSFSTMASQAV